MIPRTPAQGSLAFEPPTERRSYRKTRLAPQTKVDRQLNVRSRRFHHVPDEVKERARQVARAALASGNISPSPCEVPGCQSEPELHHDDYYRPLVVRFLCRVHHDEVHCGWEPADLPAASPAEVERARALTEALFSQLQSEGRDPSTPANVGAFRDEMIEQFSRSDPDRDYRLLLLPEGSVT